LKALVYKSFGDPEVLQWVEGWPQPVVSTDRQVLVRVMAGSVNPKDVLLRKGKFSRTLAREPLPRVSGLDIAGEVVEVGKEATELAMGDLVFGMTNCFAGGAHSEYAVLDACEIARAPATLSPVIASSVPLSAQTALQALRDHCRITRGQKVLINGASGGVGHFAVQIAKAKGAEVHAVCGSRHLDFVASLGAGRVYDYALTPAPAIDAEYHCVLDVFGKLARRDLFRQLGRKGIFVSTVPKPATLRGELLARIGLNKRSRLVQVRSCSADLNQLREWIEAGSIRPHVEKVYPVTEARDAHRHIEGKHTTGKVVLSFCHLENDPDAGTQSGVDG
jgi:NADPH:quinone reductase-like Zn-dependent oxidoreductase